MRTLVCPPCALALLVCLASLWSCASGSGSAGAQAPREYVSLETTAGRIVVELDREHAPISVANFLSYVDKGEYDGTVFHRVIPTFVVQGGGYDADLKERPSGPTIASEWTNGLKNLKGTIAMARETAPDTATREFFINVVDNPKLDTPREVSGNAGYAVFGRVIAGWDAVEKIRTGQTREIPEREMKDVPVELVVVRKAARMAAEDALAASEVNAPAR